jgi:hypothetical protein
MKEKIFIIPIYECVLRVVICDDIDQDRRKFDKIFGEFDLDGNYEALCSWSGGHNFGLFFDKRVLKNTCTIAHEVFHLTHRILEWSSSNFDKDHHEQGAMLNGYLMELVLNALKDKRKVKVKSV